eukprot:TRINITY_DN6392_c0_g1_i1.p3 TRINITY_DN6392_c0_g1~~TRINITY_DN6392_c0_g1_i1.p3  ORF type:complete len:104 (+),score=2.06 TRINITY_DN6392_c0_g1_i1:90-401(+)
MIHLKNHQIRHQIHFIRYVSIKSLPGVILFIFFDNLCLKEYFTFFAFFQQEIERQKSAHILNLAFQTLIGNFGFLQFVKTLNLQSEIVVKKKKLGNFQPMLEN